MTRQCDECPYAKPFSPGFEDCIAYQEAAFVPLDMQYRPLDLILTCAHLDARAMPMAPHRHYPRCRIGDDAARRRWAETVRADRLTLIRRMGQELNPMLEKLVVALWEAKGRQLQATPGSPEHMRALADLRDLGQRFINAVDAYLEDRQAEVAKLNLPVQATLELYAELIESWINQPNAEVPQLTDAQLERFPEDVRILFKPEAA